ncbi:hypothetical protein B0J12DRAFT_645115 [Macrophomina phaseolina]|uniref:Uncharacterized protein n=1 Tax=Macrophomina phaseolina TaxID=35725 RepID=A0ABQ8GQ80_9PEZI|nr:hypothetical protein B0J12DRAFT_645115 [Macrophomina phaseolina]
MITSIHTPQHQQDRITNFTHITTFTHNNLITTLPPHSHQPNQQASMRDTMRQTLQDHRKCNSQTRRNRSPPARTQPSLETYLPTSSPPSSPLPTSRSRGNSRSGTMDVTTINCKPVGSTSGSSISTRSNHPYTHPTTTAAAATNDAPLPPPKDHRPTPKPGVFPTASAWRAAESAYLSAYARRHSGAHQQSRAASKECQRAEPAAPQRKGWAQMYREAGPSDGEILGRWARKGWEEWQERRRGERRGEVEREERRREWERRRDERLVRWLEREGGLRQGEGRELGTWEKVEGEKRRGGRSSSEHRRRRRRNDCIGSVTVPGRAGALLYGGHAQRTAYVHDNTKPDDLDVLVSKVTDKFSQWSKEISDRAAEAKAKKREERQHKTHDAIKKSISAPKPIGEAKLSSSRLSGESSSARASFGSAISDRSMLDSGKTGGSMAERMSKRKEGLEVPFWPKGKRDKSSPASSAQCSPQHQKLTLPADEQYHKRGTQIGQFMDPELAAAPWNQHVNKRNPFSPFHKSKASSGKSKRAGSGSSKSSPTSSTFFDNSHHCSPESQRRGSDESFFGCVGISVKEEHAARRVNEGAHDEPQSKKPGFRALLTPLEDARGPMVSQSLKLGDSAQAAGRMPFGGGVSDEDEDDFFCGRAAQANSGTLGPKSGSPLVRNAQHRPNVSGAVGDRHSVAAELVDQRKHGHTVLEAVADDHRVSWWDPPLDSRAMTLEQRQDLVPARQEWAETYRTQRRATRDSRDLSLDEGPPL